MVTVTATTKASKSVKVAGKTGGTFTTTSTSYVDITGMATLASVASGTQLIAMVRFDSNGNGGTNMQTRITESTPSSTLAALSENTNTAFRYKVGTDIFSGSTTTLKMQALNSGGGQNTQITSASQIGATTGFIIGAGSTAEHNLPIKVSIGDYDVAILGNDSVSGGVIMGGAVSRVSNVTQVVLTVTIDNVVSVGITYVLDKATFSDSTLPKTALLFDFEGTNIEVSP